MHFINGSKGLPHFLGDFAHTKFLRMGCCLKGLRNFHKTKLPHNFVQGTLLEGLPDPPAIKAHDQTQVLQNYGPMFFLWKKSLVFGPFSPPFWEQIKLGSSDPFFSTGRKENKFSQRALRAIALGIQEGIAF
jgi:hypothetical protein